jgi:hypothetical protein
MASEFKQNYSLLSKDYEVAGLCPNYGSLAMARRSPERPGRLWQFSVFVRISGACVTRVTLMDFLSGPIIRQFHAKLRRTIFWFSNL